MLLALKLTGSPAAVAATLIVLEVPQVTLGLVAGVFVDRWERRRVMLASDLLRALLVLGFVAVNSAGLLWLLFVLAFAQAMRRHVLLPGTYGAGGGRVAGRGIVRGEFAESAFAGPLDSARS